jgi:4-diphosphocytidyl-2-C-methyl-D-erythritol kinase
VGTADAYRLWDTVGASRRPDTLRFMDAFLKGDIEGMARFGGNALEKAAVQLLPPVGEALKQMQTTGAGYSAMTGSGAAVFGVFETERDALLAQGKLAGAHWSAVACSLPAAPVVR